MIFVRVFLLAAGTFSLVAGVAYIARPGELAALADLTLSSPTAVIEVQGFYGGQLLGMGAAMLLGVLRPRFVVPGLWLVVAPLAGTAFGRLCGAVTSGAFPPTIAALFFLEAATAVVGALLLRREMSRAALPTVAATD
ncbi:MAG: DUF4345 family protein [Candidatus Binatia bacterium]